MRWAQQSAFAACQHGGEVKKANKKKLNLRKETVKGLTAEILKEAAGGDNWWATTNIHCSVGWCVPPVGPW
jgi:hypothetical protein